MRSKCCTGNSQWQLL